MLIHLVIQSETGLTKKEISCQEGLSLAEFKVRHLDQLKDGWITSVWNENRSEDYVLKDEGRVEVSGPLLVDPKVARMKRAAIKHGQKPSARRHAK